MAIWDAEKSVTIRNQALHHAVDHTPYEGVEVKGWPITITSRGEIVFAEGRPLSNSGRGRFLPCQRPFVPRTQASPSLEY
jgi:dihydropyrimidinase